MKNIEKKQYRAIGHGLKPVVTIAGAGLSEGVVSEAERALSDHELIKIKLTAIDRDEKQALVNELCSALKAELVQVIGNTALLLRRSTKPNPKLSNLIRTTQA